MDNLLSFNFDDTFFGMIIRFAICILCNWILIDTLYYKKSHRHDFYFTFMLTSIAIFFLVFFMIFVLEDLKTKTSIGIGIGLFGIFSIMRYRTDAMPVREMTYLFVIICMAVINAIAANVSLWELLITDIIIIGCVAVCEKRLNIQPSKLVQYDRIELIKPERREELIKDLEERLGLKITKVQIGAVDMLRDMAIIRVFYNSDDKMGGDEINETLKLRREQLTTTNG